MRKEDLKSAFIPHVLSRGEEPTGDFGLRGPMETKAASEDRRFFGRQSKKGRIVNERMMKAECQERDWKGERWELQKEWKRDWDEKYICIGVCVCNSYGENKM